MHKITPDLLPLAIPISSIKPDPANPRENQAERYHPTQKPVKLLVALLQGYSQLNGLIVDFYLGSGTTMIATHQVGGGRRCYGCEIEPKYAAVILERMSLLGLTPELSKE